MNWFEQYTAYTPAQTLTTSTTWAGWQLVNPKCYECRHCVVRNGIPACYCMSRTIRYARSIGDHDTCESYSAKGEESGG